MLFLQIFVRVGHNGANGLGVLNGSIVNHIHQFVHRVRLHIDKFILIQVLVGLYQVVCHINIYFLITEGNCGADGNQEIHIFTAITGFLFQLPCRSRFRRFVRSV